MKRRLGSLLLGLVAVVVMLALGGPPAHAGAGVASSTDINGNPIQVPTYYANSPEGDWTDWAGNVHHSGTAIRKFVDTLPLISTDGGTTGANNLGQYIPVAVPDTSKYAGADYYEIGIVEYQEKMHTDLPKGSWVRGYVQLETPANASISKHIALHYPDSRPIQDKNGNQVYAVDTPHYLGPAIRVVRGTAVRIKYTNYLPTGHFDTTSSQREGDLFLPVDFTMMGAGTGPLGGTEMYTQNRVVTHLHGGDTPWISDGTPIQWFTPAGEQTSYKRGDTTENVPDMPDPGNGSVTIYYNNNMSGRMLWSHDHALGITRLNVYAGMAAAYFIVDPPGTGKNALNLPSGPNPLGIPLVIQTKTFVPQDIAQEDSKWDTTHWGQPGDLWFPHVYEANQDPNSFDGTNPPGRWDYGPWFWPIFPVDANHQPLPDGSYGHVTQVPEAFCDTPVINGTAYPTLTVDPKAYRFRVLNATNARYINLGLYVAADKNTINAADPTQSSSVTMCDASFAGLRSDCTEVKMIPFYPGTAPFPTTGGLLGTGWGTPDARVGGIPDPTTVGPDIIEIGNEGGLLPAPVDIPSTPINYEYNKRSVTVLNVLEHGLYLGPAERADIVVDFSKFAGQTLILYNDAPAPLPAGDDRNDYYTGNPDFTSVGGAPTTKPGYGPNTRTIMQIKVTTNTVTNNFDLATLQSEQPAAYAATQPRPIVPEQVYNAPFGENFTNHYAKIYTGSLDFPTLDFIAPDDLMYTTIADATTITGPLNYVLPGETTVNTLATSADTASVPAATEVYVKKGDLAQIPVRNKAIQELFDPWGRMNATFGVELPFTNSQIQTTIPLGYHDPITEDIKEGETQIWKITHNGVDTHPGHIHLVNWQLIDRVGWDGTVKPPDATEVGWQETTKMNPLEDIIVAVRAKAPKLPFGLPVSMRPLATEEPIGSTAGFMNLDPKTGNPYPAGQQVTNQITDFGWEYVWHCHILGHEENDFMRPFVLRYPAQLPAAPSPLTVTPGAIGMELAWTDPTPVIYGNRSTYGNYANEIGFHIERATGAAGNFVFLAKTLANTTSFTDTTAQPNTTYRYRVAAFNAAGLSPYSNTSIGGGLAMSTHLGVFRGGNWYLDYNNNHTWDAGIDLAYNGFGLSTDVPVVGDWNGDGKTEVAVFRNGKWYLDANGNGQWDAGVDTYIASFGQTGDIPVAGDWNSDGKTEVGVFRNGKWYLDTNGNGQWDPSLDTVVASFGTTGDIPVAGDWNGDGKAEIGVFRAGTWYLDYDGNGQWNSGTDITYAGFGQSGDHPVVGDWNNDGKAEIGFFRSGQWTLDSNANGQLDAADSVFSGFGKPGDLPVVGNWP